MGFSAEDESAAEQTVSESVKAHNTSTTTKKAGFRSNMHSYIKTSTNNTAAVKPGNQTGRQRESWREEEEDDEVEPAGEPLGDHGAAGC